MTECRCCMYSMRSCGSNAALSWAAPANFLRQHIFHCAHDVLDCTVGLRMNRRGLDMVDTKTLQLMPEGTSKLSPTVCGHPFRHTTTHEPGSWSTSHGVSTFVKDV